MRSWRPTPEQLEWLRTKYYADPSTGELYFRETGKRVRSQAKPYREIMVTNLNLGLRKHVQVHALVWFLCCGGWPDQIDHFDHDRSNNALSNLRLVTSSQNGHNRYKISAPTSSRYKGVHWNGRRKRWFARFTKDGKVVFERGFHDERSAALAYNAAAREHGGEFAYVNQVEE